MLINMVNGNAHITLSEAGERITTWPDDEQLSLSSPRQMDLKITNWCNMSKICLYCHEMSTRSGKHANIADTIEGLSGLTSPAEIAIGGGSPLHHPEIDTFLQAIRDLGHIPNITVNQLHLPHHAKKLEDLLRLQLLFGIGLSVRDAPLLAHCKTTRKYDLLRYKHLVLHLIPGVNKLSDLDFLVRAGFEKFLILGYKNFGWGKTHKTLHPEIDQEVIYWYQQLPRFFGKGVTFSFDNLGVEQLGIRRFFTDETWKKFYQGDDGFAGGSMYVDAVEQTFARSSTSPDRVSWSEMSIVEYFQSLKE